MLQLLVDRTKHSDVAYHVGKWVGFEVNVSAAVVNGNTPITNVVRTGTLEVVSKYRLRVNDLTFTWLEIVAVDPGNGHIAIDYRLKRQRALAWTRASKLAQLVTWRGGFTVDPTTFTSNPIRHGYAVARPGNEVVIPLAVGHLGLVKRLAVHLRPLVRKCQALGLQMGGWVDRDTGLLIIEPVVIVSDYLEAMKLAEANKQKAIFNFKTGRVVEV